MSRSPDATSRFVLVPLAGFGEPTKDYLLAAAKAGLPPVAAVKALLARGVRRGEEAAMIAMTRDPREGGRSCGWCGRAGGAGRARGEDGADGSGLPAAGGTPAECGVPSERCPLRGSAE